MACWAVAYLSECSEFAIEAIIEVNVIPRCVALLSSPKFTIQAACVRIIGKICAGDDLGTQTAIDCGALPALGKLLTSPSRPILREACWAISNVTAGNSEQVAAVIKAELIPPIIMLLSSHDSSIRLEACWTVVNATEVGPHAIKHLVSQGCIKPLCEIIKNGDFKIVQVVLQGLENILRADEALAMDSPKLLNPYALLVEEAQGLDAIKQLELHDNIEISLKATEIIEKYFPDLK